MRFNTVAASVLLALPALSTASAAGHKQKQETLREWYDKVPWSMSSTLLLFVLSTSRKAYNAIEPVSRSLIY
jgi:hypothetical protein